MVDLADQIRAWGNAVAARGREPVRAEDILDRGPLTLRAASSRSPRLRRQRRRQLVVVAAAACVVVAAIAIGIAGSGNDTPDRVSTGASTAATGEDQQPGPRSGEVTFDRLGMHTAVAEKMGTLRSASTPEELADLWSDAGLAPRPPAIDFDKQVVVSITIPDDACPPTLEAFDRDGATITPRFVETAPVCNKPLIPKTYVAALDWASTGSSFRLFLEGQPSYEFGDTYLPVKRPESARSTATTSPGATCQASRPEATASTMEIRVFFLCGVSGVDPMVPVIRRVPRTAAVLQATVEAWVRGPTPEESAAGLTSPVPTEAAQAAVQVTIRDGLALVEIAKDLRSINNLLATSNASGAFYRALSANAFQFPSVQAVALAGQCPGEVECLETPDGPQVVPTTRVDWERAEVPCPPPFPTGSSCR